MIVQRIISVSLHCFSSLEPPLIPMLNFLYLISISTNFSQTPFAYFLKHFYSLCFLIFLRCCSLNFHANLFWKLPKYPITELTLCYDFTFLFLFPETYQLLFRFFLSYSPFRFLDFKLGILCVFFTSTTACLRIHDLVLLEWVFFKFILFIWEPFISKSFHVNFLFSVVFIYSGFV